MKNIFASKTALFIQFFITQKQHLITQKNIEQKVHGNPLNIFYYSLFLKFKIIILKYPKKTITSFMHLVVVVGFLVLKTNQKKTPDLSSPEINNQQKNQKRQQS